MDVSMLDRIKFNLIIDHSMDDVLLKQLLAAAVDYAEGYQHIESGYYKKHPMSETTKQAVIMLASHWYESRDGSTGGFFADSTQAAQQTRTAVNDLLRLDREWKV